MLRLPAVLLAFSPPNDDKPTVRLQDDVDKLPRRNPSIAAREMLQQMTLGDREAFVHRIAEQGLEER